MTNRRDKPADEQQDETLAEQERRKGSDRREVGRRVSERRMGGIGEVIPERRAGPRRQGGRRTRSSRRD